MDFKITFDGELETIDNDIDIVFLQDDLKFQQAFCIVKSVTTDWYAQTTVGADLEEIIGKLSSNENAEIGKEKIIEALTKEGTYRSTDIYIVYKLEKNNITYKIYLRNADKLTSKILYASIDLVSGINIRLGVD